MDKKIDIQPFLHSKRLFLLTVRFANQLYLLLPIVIAALITIIVINNRFIFIN
jgi:hypothetical protein